MHKHGPCTRPCAGSHKPPLGVSNLSRGNRDHTAAAAAAVPSDDSASVSDATDTTAQPNLWSPDECTVIKHIPKSARPACASHLAEVLRAVVAKPEDGANWVHLQLEQPYLAISHNLSNMVKKRISQFPSRDPLRPIAYDSSGHNAWSTIRYGGPSN